MLLHFIILPTRSIADVQSLGEWVVACLSPMAYQLCTCCLLVVFSAVLGGCLVLVLAEKSPFTHTLCFLKLVVTDRIIEWFGLEGTLKII